MGFMPTPVLVDTASVDRGVFEVTVREEGKTRVVERYVISSPVAAYARRLEFDVGDEIQEGEVLLYLEPLRSQVLDPRTRAEAEARVTVARAALLVAQQEVSASEADATYAETDVARVRQLHERGAMSQTALDLAEAAALRTMARREAARRVVDVAEYDIEAANTALRYSQTAGAGGEMVSVQSPVSGRVLRLLHESEGVVAAGQALIEVGDPDLLEVEVEVLSADAVKIAPGTEVRFERWGGEDALQGVVRVVEPVGFTKISALGVEEQRVLTVVDIVSPAQEWKRLGDQYRVDAIFIVWRGDDVLSLPSSALFRHRDGWATFVVEDDVAHLREVEIGRRSGLRAEIRSGLSTGEIVIVHPDDSIEDGSAIDIVG
ncbi:MAG: HlyD family efflux transporter periplasmic adaptor subunit [Acidobacteria bacterium]|nr:HlyD family efflux transporter periplasmic adaptor subunit [Acidobacteriota bacterium]